MSQQALHRNESWGSRHSPVHNTANLRYQNVPGYSGLARSARVTSAYQSAGSDNYRGSAASALRSDHSQGSAPSADMQLAVRHGTPAPTQAPQTKTISDLWQFENVRYLLNEARVNLNNGTLLHAFSEENAQALGPWGIQVHDRLALRLQELAAATVQMQHNAAIEIGPGAEETEFWEKFSKEFPQRSTSKTSLNAELQRLEEDFALEHAAYNANQDVSDRKRKPKRKNKNSKRGQKGNGKDPLIKAEKTEVSLTTIPLMSNKTYTGPGPQCGYKHEESKVKLEDIHIPGRGDGVQTALPTSSTRRRPAPPPLKLEHCTPRHEKCQNSSKARKEYGHNLQHRNSYANRGQTSNHDGHAEGGYGEAIIGNTRAAGSRDYATNHSYARPDGGYAQTLNNGYAYAGNNHSQASSNLHAYAGGGYDQFPPSGYAHFFGGSRHPFNNGFAHMGGGGPRPDNYSTHTGGSSVWLNAHHGRTGGGSVWPNGSYGQAHADNGYGRIASGQVAHPPRAYTSNMVVRGPSYRIAYATKLSTSQPLNPGHQNKN